MKNKDKLIQLGQQVNQTWLDAQIKWVISKIEHNMKKFGDKFPSASATNGRYRVKENDDWTNGFWTGMLWLAYEVSQKEEFLKQAKRNLQSFQERLDKHFVLEHHDIGFLYSLSAGAEFEVLHDEESKAVLLRAADLLLSRFHEQGNFIQAWGKYGDPKEYRLIIDSLMNLPLLFKASELSGKEIYREAAVKHYQTLLSTVIRPDGSTYHTYYFDPESGKPLYGKTAQGNRDDSIWARGQAWAVLGLPLNENYVRSNVFPEKYQKIVDVFLEHLPEDLIPYWDFDYTDGKPSEKDSSAAAIAACGLIEAGKAKVYPQAEELAKGLIYQLGEHYSTQKIEENEGLLLHGVYAHSENKGVDEPNLWGDYFYFEALMRLHCPKWRGYW